jgi:hypothetical protein
LYVAVLADIVRSRDLGLLRAPTQKTFTKVVTRLNREYSTSIAVNFTISRGDEFQGLLTDATPLADLIWNLESWFLDADLHIGIGYGRLETPIRRASNVLELDGPAFHNARAAIDEARERLGGVFLGFGAEGDRVLNGFARLMRRHRERLSKRQRQILALLRQSLSQTAIADQLGRTKQAISDHVRASGAEAYREGEEGWRAALSHFANPSTIGGTAS